MRSTIIIKKISYLCMMKSEDVSFLCLGDNQSDRRNMLNGSTLVRRQTHRRVKVPAPAKPSKQPVLNLEVKAVR